ncbi:MAG: type III secretion system chaperone [Pseudomonadota bacterium]
MRRFVSILVVALVAPLGAFAAEDDGMTTDRIDALIGAIGEDVARVDDQDVWTFAVEEVALTVIADPKHDRMRVVAAIAPADILPADLILRLMQSNFDSALDARYAIARGNLWATYIHPLSPLTDKQFISGVGQTANLVKSFGTTFSSGGLTFGGGDSQALILRGLIERLQKKGEAI